MYSLAIDFFTYIESISKESISNILLCGYKFFLNTECSILNMLKTDEDYGKFTLAHNVELIDGSKQSIITGVEHLSNVYFVEIAHCLSYCVIQKDIIQAIINLQNASLMQMASFFEQEIP